MTVREDIKMLLAKENVTMTELAKDASKKWGKNFTVNSLSQKLLRDSMKYSEVKQLVETLGYKIIFQKED